MQAKALGSNSREVLRTLEMLAASYDRSGELEKAEALFQRLESWKLPRAIIIDGPKRARIHCSFNAIGFESSRLADFYDRHGRLADAEKAYLAAIARADAKDSESHALEPALDSYQNYLRNHRRFAEALQIQARIITMHQKTGNPPDPNLEMWDRVQIASLYEEAQQYDEANKVYEQALTHFS